MYLITAYSPHTENLVHLANDSLKINRRWFFKFLTTELWLGSKILGETWQKQTTEQAMASNKLHQGVLQGKVNACKRLEGTTASHAGSLGRPGKEGVRDGRGAQSPERKARAPPQPRARTPLQPAHPRTVGRTAPQGHRNEATLHNLPPRRQAPARHPACGAPESCCAWTDRLGTRVGSPDSGDRERGCQGQRELGTESQGGRAGGDSRSGKRKQGCGGQGAGSRERGHGAGPGRSAHWWPDPAREGAGEGAIRPRGHPRYTCTRPTWVALWNCFFSPATDMMGCWRPRGGRLRTRRCGGGRRAAAGPAAAGAAGAGARRGTRACAERHPDVRAGDAAS